MLRLPRLVSATLCLALSASLIGAGKAGQKFDPNAMVNHHAAYRMTMPDGRIADVFRNGIVSVLSRDGRTSYTRMIPVPRGDTPTKDQVLRTVTKPQQPFSPNSLIVVFRSGITGVDSLSIGAKQLKAARTAYSKKQVPGVPQYTSDAATNALLAKSGTDSIQRLFSSTPRGTLSAMRARAAQTFHNSSFLDIGNAYRLHVTNGAPRTILARLKKLSSVAYASLDWTVTTMDTGPRLFSPAELRHMSADASSVRTRAVTTASSTVQPVLPTNYAVLSSEQSLLNATNTNSIAAFDEIERAFGQLPGQGEIITNVSLGDLDDASAVNNPNDPCNSEVSVWGPTTTIISGQRYIDWPSLPLIPTYTADSTGNLNGTGEVCAIDPALGEVGLDFSMMAPLPHNAQRSSDPGRGASDLLGIAPGASYRLVVPASYNPDIADIDAALLAAARQAPHPDVITASLGLGVDVYGFPGRFLEDDPLSESVIASIIAQYDTVVCVSANDGLRLFTNAAIGPSGGSAPTNTVAINAHTSDINDIALSNAPSLDYDSGSIAVGGVTLDDVFAVEPQDPANLGSQVQHEYPETRYDGFTLFSSGFGTRVNIAAPADNVVALSHRIENGVYDPTAVDVGLEGGTSASAPEVAAAVAVVRQVARLTGHTMSALQVRDFLTSSGDTIFPAPQSDVPLLMGNALNVGHAVETLLAQARKTITPAVPRVAIAQRRRDGDPNELNSLLNGAFVTATNPALIDMTGPLSTLDETETGANQEAWITIAPDWEGLPSGTTFKLYVDGHAAQPLATTASARLLPAQILNAAGLPLASSSSRTVSLIYVARLGSGARTNSIRAGVSHAFSITAPGRSLSTQFSLTFGPTATTHRDALAPIVPAVVTGSTIPVTYDLTNVAGVSNPTLVVSEPGRPSPVQYTIFNSAFSVALTALKGTVNVPVSSLQGGGLYGIAIHYGNAQGANTLQGGFGRIFPLYSDFAFTRVQTTSAVAPPPAPLLSSSTSGPGHFVEIPYGGSFTVSYDVSSVSGATGAAVEISSGGYTPEGSLAPFNNPNGTVRDHNGLDTGSVYYAAVSGTSGQVTIAGEAAHLYPSLYESVRVIPLAGSTPVGESSGVSTVTMDGITPADGGFINLGYGIDQNGNDAFLTSGQVTLGGEVLSSLETFDQAANALVNTTSSLNNGMIFRTYGWGIWGNDTGLIDMAYNATGAPYLNATFNASGGYITGLWTPQIPTGLPGLQINAAAPNGATTTAAFYGIMTCGIFGACGDYELFSSDLSQNSTGPIYDIQAPLQNYSRGYYWMIAQNHNTNTAVLTAADAYNGALPPSLVSVDLASGQITSFQSIGNDNITAGFALDSSTNKAFLSIEDSSFGIYDLTAKTGTRYMLPLDPGGNYIERASDIGNLYNSGYNAAADETHHLFAVAQVLPPNILSDNNALSRVYLYDESGNLQETIPGFALYASESFTGFGPESSWLQLNPSRREGYLFGPFAQQLVPFSY